MISIRINGESREFEDSITIQELIQRIQLTSQTIAVAVNSEIVPRSAFEKVRVQDKDHVEIIRAVGGG